MRVLRHLARLPRCQHRRRRGGITHGRCCKRSNGPRRPVAPDFTHHGGPKLTLTSARTQRTAPHAKNSSTGTPSKDTSPHVDVHQSFPRDLPLPRIGNSRSEVNFCNLASMDARGVESALITARAAHKLGNTKTTRSTPKKGRSTRSLVAVGETCTPGCEVTALVAAAAALALWVRIAAKAPNKKDAETTSHVIRCRIRLISWATFDSINSPK